MFKIEGLDALSRELKEAEQAFSGMEEVLGTVQFDADDPSSIEAAIQEVERLVDERLGSYASNSIVGPMAEEMKEKFRQAIIEAAAEARLADDESE